MNFEIRAAETIPSITLIYRPEEYSFGVEPDGDPIPADSLSIQLDTLQLHVNVDAQVVYVDGLCAHTIWSFGNLRPPAATRGQLLALGFRLVAGVSIQLNSISGWPVVADFRNGWIRIGEATNSAETEAVEITPGTILVLRQGDLKAVWLKPLQLPDIPKELRGGFSRRL